MSRFDTATAEGILFTDQYQLTMAQLYFRAGLHERPAQFDYFFRDYPDYGPHKAGYCIAAGLEWLVEWMRNARFRDKDIEHMAGMRGKAGTPVFADDFLEWLRENGSFDSLSIEAVPEGRVVHANVPMAVVKGPLAMAQILETPLLNHLNYPTLIATKAARIRDSAAGGLMVEFGMRRGPAKAVTAGARAALIGGADFTSNAGASHALGLPPKGTHAHSMVQAFIAMGEDELAAFRAYAEVYPDDCLLLVDTVNTLESGVPNAITVFEELRSEGHAPLGIRLDSGDLAYLSVRASKMLDEAGFEDATIFLSNELDELTIWQIRTQIQQSAPKLGTDADHVLGRLAYGVGTRLITSAGEGALNGVYKLVALQTGGEWKPALKVSESRSKTLNPGHKRVWRMYGTDGSAMADLMTLADEDPDEWEPIHLRHPVEASRERKVPREDVSEFEPLLEPVCREGTFVYEPETLDAMRQRRDRDLARLDDGVRRNVNPHIYHVSVSQKLWELKEGLIAAMKGAAPGRSSDT